MNDAVAIGGCLQRYAWGGREYIPNFLGEKTPSEGPCAEYWLGTHPKGPARLKGTDRTLEEYLGAPLPFLFKVLDACQMLSIQVHPNRETAAAGFQREEAAGIPRDAPHRNFRDENHKPELGVAITDFYLLHGFRPERQIRRGLASVPGWEAALLPFLDRGGVPELYRYVMQASAAELRPLLLALDGSLRTGDYGKQDPEYWARRGRDHFGRFDRGLFSVLWLNLVHLRPGEGIFQAAGVPHAYLEGACLELMADSDNVLRGGLTAKHIDVEQLLANVDFSEVAPTIIRPEPGPDGWQHYPTPARDFALSFRRFAAGETLEFTTEGPAILLLREGKINSAGLTLDEGNRSVVVRGGGSYLGKAETSGLVFRATTP